MRLIDADEFKVQIAGMTVLGDYPPSMVNAVHELIDRQPTVRDTEKSRRRAERPETGILLNNSQYRR